MIVPSPLSVTVPLDEVPTAMTLSASPSASVSLASTSIVTARPGSVNALSFSASGGVLGGGGGAGGSLTHTVIVAVSESPSSSVIS